jgi:hypothetical protein
MRMKFSDFYYGRRAPYSKEDIIKYCAESTNYEGEDLSSANALLLFDRGTRRSWLVRSSKRLYKLIDDREDDKPKINWSQSLSPNKAIDIKVRSVGPTLKVQFSFREGREYIVDPTLFQAIDVQEALKSFIRGNVFSQGSF